MKRNLILISVSLLLASCSLLKPLVKEPQLVIPNDRYEKMVEESVDEILSGGWLSDFLTTNNERPIVMMSKISNNAKVQANNTGAIGWFNRDLAESGQVRVVKSNEAQQEMMPYDLAQGQSVDFVLSANFEKQVDTSPTITIFAVSLWSNTSTLPIVVVKKEIIGNPSE